MKCFLAFAALCALAGSASALCKTKGSGPRCLERNELGGRDFGGWTSPNGPCTVLPAFGINNPSCFVDSSNTLLQCDCAAGGCGCDDSDIVSGGGGSGGSGGGDTCDNSSNPSGSCSADRNKYCGLPLYKNTKNTMCDLCGVDTAACGKTCFRTPSISAANKAAILKAHNDYRNDLANGRQKAQNNAVLPKGCNIRELLWDDDLAEGAQRWADQCPDGAHDVNRRTPGFQGFVGQNMYWSASTVFTDSCDAALVKAVDSWQSEFKDFPSSKRSSFSKSSDYRKPIGHFTQVNWAETTRVGCGCTGYKKEGEQYPYQIRVVCNYGMGGNMNGAAMYKDGPPAGDCPNGKSSKYNGLCK